MSEMVEMVIKIPKDTLDVVNSFGLWRTQRFIQDTVSRALAHGVVLPKGHGDLVDMNTVTSTYNLQGELTSYDAVVVLEADKEA